MDFTAICRTCLRTDALSPIFPYNRDQKPYSTAIFIVMGVKVEKDDGLPQQMCGHCIYHLNNSISFRNNCKVAEAKLLQIKTEYDNKNRDVKIYKIESDGHGIHVNADLKREETKSSLDLDFTKSEANYIKDFKNSISLKRHSTENTTEPERIQCVICNKDLALKSLESHMMRNHPTEDNRRTKCEQCSKYIVKEKMNRHVHMMHKLRRYQCEHCNSMFKTRNSLVEHLKANCAAKKKKKNTSKGKSRDPVECEVCHKRMLRASLKTHMNIKHAGLGPVCEHCGRRFGNKLRLAEHLRAKHGHEKLKCSACEFSCSSSLALQNHARRHRGEKPFVCERCGAGFHAASLLAQHRKSHNALRTIACTFCPAVFKTSNTLSSHKLTVHGDARHRCRLCPRSYPCRQYAVKHMRTVHLYTVRQQPLNRVQTHEDAASVHGETRPS